MGKEFHLEEELKKLPARPGVYLMHDASGEVIYVGKAVSLKNRVRQYFQSSRNKTAKILRMVEHIDWFEYIVTDSETEALVLECNLIKEYRPRYNTMLVDDKGYPFIRVTVEEQFPRVLMTREMKKNKSRYFGPYTSALAVRDTLELLQKLYPTRTCRRVLPRDIGKERPCLNAHMGRCPAPCTGLVSEEVYRENVEKVLRFLDGDYKGVLSELKAKMKAASEAEDYEHAIEYRELIRSVEHVALKQKAADAESTEDRDFIAAALGERDAVVSVFFVRGGKLLGRDHYHLTMQEGTGEAEILESFVKQFYSGTPVIPREVILETEITDGEAIEAYLSARRGRKVSLIVPKRGQKEHFILLAKKNAKMVLDSDKDRLEREEARTTGAVRGLEELLGLSGLHRMEAFDISNISGFESVGSMVVFQDGRPKKNDYRKFRIRTVSGPNDYASMEEVLTRRFRHAVSEENEGFSALPDLLLMDGGKGQVHVAEEVLQKAGLPIPVAGMVKDDRHRTRGLYFHDEELPIDTHSESFHLLTRIQDEAHRFAVTFHRGLHTQNTIRSVLSEIPGVGKKRELALIRHFESIDALKKASVEEIASTEGFHRKAAEEVYRFVHREE